MKTEKNVAMRQKQKPKKSREKKREREERAERSEMLSPALRVSSSSSSSSSTSLKATSSKKSGRFARSFCASSSSYYSSHLLSSTTKSDWKSRLHRHRKREERRRSKRASTTSSAVASSDFTSSLALVASEMSSSHPLLRDATATAATIFGSLLWVKLFDQLAKNEVLEAKLSRKLVHVTSGTFFAITWCLFGDQWYSKVFATIVPSLQALRLFAIGSGLIENKNAVRAVSREGGKEELLYGPFYYTIVLMLTTLLFWRESPVGFLVVSTMCGGDGVADIVGRRLGKNGKKWPKPFDERKSFAGSAAMVVAGFLFTVSLTHLFGVLGYFPNDRVFGGPDDVGYYVVIALVCVSCAIVEALPASKIDDNISVAAVAAALGSLAFL